MTTYEFDWHGTNIPIDVHRCDGKAKAVILYYHGGGLMYGSGRDLPEDYINAITQSGYHLVCMNYLLAPESPLSHILSSAYDGLLWVLEHRRDWLGDACCPYVLFGRSAGAFLAVTLAHQLRQEGRGMPAALWLFYGYYHLNHPEFVGPSPHYQSFPRIPAELIPDFQSSAPRACAPVEDRYFLYVYARQQGMWPQMLQAKEGVGVPRGELSQLPPTFLTASTADQDVPYVFSQTMHVSMPGSVFYRVYGLEHDYDRDPQRPESQELYQKALEWLDGRILA